MTSKPQNYSVKTTQEELNAVSELVSLLIYIFHYMSYAGVIL